MMSYYKHVVDFTTCLLDNMVYGLAIKTDTEASCTSIEYIYDVHDFLRCKRRERKYNKNPRNGIAYEVVTIASIMSILMDAQGGERERWTDIMTSTIETLNTL